MEPILKASNLTKAYFRKKGLNGLNLEIPAGISVF